MRWVERLRHGKDYVDPALAEMPPAERTEREKQDAYILRRIVAHAYASDWTSDRAEWLYQATLVNIFVARKTSPDATRRARNRITLTAIAKIMPGDINVGDATWTAYMARAKREPLIVTMLPGLFNGQLADLLAEVRAGKAKR